MPKRKVLLLWAVGLAVGVPLLACACGLSAPQAPTEEPTLTPRPSTLAPTATPSPPPTDTLIPTPTDTPAPIDRPPPADTPSPLAAPDSASSGPFRAVAPLDGALADWMADMPASSVEGLRVLPDGSVWLYTEQAVARLRGDTWDIALPSILDTLIGVDDFGRVWVVSEDTTQILFWDGDSWTFYGADEGWTHLPFSDGWAWWSPVRRGVHTGQGGELWLATDREVRVFDGRYWKVFTQLDMGMEPAAFGDLAASYHIAIVKGGAEVWVGGCYYSGPGPMGGQGVRWFDGETWHGGDAESPVGDNCVSEIVEDSSGRVWVGSENDVWRYDPATEEWTRFALPEPLLFGRNFGHVRQIAVDPSGDPWIVMQHCLGASCDGPSVLYHVREGEWSAVAQSEWWFMPMQQVVFDADGTGWLFWGGAIYRLEGEEPQPVAALDALALTVDSAGRPWFVAAHEGQFALWTLDIEAGD